MASARRPKGVSGFGEASQQRNIRPSIGGEGDFFAHVIFAILGTEPDGSRKEYSFMAELSNYPSQAPMVRIWDMQKNVPLDVA